MKITSTQNYNLINNSATSSTSSNTNNNESLDTSKYDSAVKVDISEKSKELLSRQTISFSNTKTYIDARVDYESESDRRVLMHEAHYSKVNEENKKFENPRGHILDKYFTPVSPYYIEGLTEQERKIAAASEFDYLKDDAAYFVDFRDPIFRGMPPVNGEIESLQESMFQRDQINSQFHQMLDDFNIQIPSSTQLNFTIEPYDMKVKITGSDDLQLTSSIEKVFNTADNVYQLYYHVNNVSFFSSNQYTTEEYQKYHLTRNIKEETGYDLRDLDIVDGKFVTPDGTDVYDLYMDSIRNGDSVPDFAKEMVIARNYERIQKYASNNYYDSVPEMSLSIDYKNGSFYDVDQLDQYGTGDRQWVLDRINHIKQNNYKSEPLDDEPLYSSSAKKDLKQDIYELFSNFNIDYKLEKQDLNIMSEEELIVKYLMKMVEDNKIDNPKTFIDELIEDGYALNPELTLKLQSLSDTFE